MTKDINTFIRNRRKELRLTQSEVAKACGVSEATVSRWESGDIANMSRSKIQALANVLRISPVTLINNSDEENARPKGDILAELGYPAPSPIDTYDAEILAELQRLHDDPETRMLLSATRKLSKKDILFMVDLAKRMHSEE